MTNTAIQGAASAMLRRALVRMRASLSLTLIAALTGCATQFFGSAPSPIPGRAYVVGQRAAKRVVWLCPTDRAHGDCDLVDVEEM
jgi:hypothetical protein